MENININSAYSLESIVNSLNRQGHLVFRDEKGNEYHDESQMNFFMFPDSLGIPELRRNSGIFLCRNDRKFIDLVTEKIEDRTYGTGYTVLTCTEGSKKDAIDSYYPFITRTAFLMALLKKNEVQVVLSCVHFDSIDDYYHITMVIAGNDDKRIRYIIDSDKKDIKTRQNA